MQELDPSHLLTNVAELKKGAKQDWLISLMSSAKKLDFLFRE